MPQTANRKTQPKPLTSVMEDYLEAIFDLYREKKVVRVRDIAGKLDVKMPTVTSMLKTLSGRGLVHYEKYEYVELTAKGNRVGREIHRRHEALYRFLRDILNVPPKTADDEACKMEHALGAGTLERLTKFMTFIKQCSREGESWLRMFEIFQKTGSIPTDCQALALASKKSKQKTKK
jgi:DtxR family Mn-dependent transcriptional regulator